MKSFKQYIIESKQTYEFKIKLAGDYEKDAVGKIKEALAKYNVESCSSGKRAPIQESPVDFPEHSNINVTIFDVVVTYPTTSAQIRENIAEKLGITSSCVKVRSTGDLAEEEINHEFDEKSGESLLTKDYDASNNQKLVGDSRTMELLKELSKTKNCGEQVKGYNDQILAKSMPSEKLDGPAQKAAKQNTVSPVGSRKVKLPTAKSVRGK